MSAERAGIAQPPPQARPHTALEAGGEVTHDPRMATWTPTARTLSQPAANLAHSRCSMNGLIDSYHFCRCHCWTAVREQNAGGLLTEERRQSPAPLCADSPTRGLAQAPTSLHTHAPRSSVVWTLQQAPAPAPSTHPPLHLSPFRGAPQASLKAAVPSCHSPDSSHVLALFSVWHW